MHNLKCISMMEIAKEYGPALISEILAGFKGMAVSSCINLKEELVFRSPWDFQSRNGWVWRLLPQALWALCVGSRSWLQLRTALSELWAAAGLSLCHCSAFDQHRHIPDNITFLTTSPSWQSLCHVLGALEITTVSPCQCGCWVWLHSLGLTEEGKGSARWDFLTATPRLLARCKLIPFLAAVVKVVLREVLTVGIAQSREEKKIWKCFIWVVSCI